MMDLQAILDEVTRRIGSNSAAAQTAANAGKIPESIALMGRSDGMLELMNWLVAEEKKRAVG